MHNAIQANMRSCIAGAADASWLTNRSPPYERNRDKRYGLRPVEHPTLQAALPQPRARAAVVLRDEFDAGGFDGRAQDELKVP